MLVITRGVNLHFPMVFPWFSHENLHFPIPMVFPWFSHGLPSTATAFSEDPPAISRDFGAFVDVGSERSGLVHISRMSDGFAAGMDENHGKTMGKPWENSD